MPNQDWEKLGEEIKRTVQDAIDSQDFNKLNQTISNTINDAARSVRSGLRNAGDAFTNATQSAAQEASKRVTESVYRQTEQKNMAMQRNIDTQLYIKPTSAKVGGILMTVLGSCIGVCSGTVLLIMLIYALLTGDFSGGILFTLICMGIVLLVTSGLIGKGIAKLGRVKRFHLYRDEVRRTGYCEVKRLSELTRKSPKKVLKDLERMIKDRWFKEGHLDGQRTCLIASNEVYAKYQEMLEAQRINAENERIRKEEEAKAAESVAPEVQTILKEGNDYICKIHECNDAIPGIEISAKISRMEELVDRIFDRVEQDPSSVRGIRRLMDYYLPTTVKLLEAYDELDKQPVQGDNIVSSKREIEKTLDTLNAAFEKLLDDLFERTAWDVSSDISVLNTMLAQEGLGQDDFS
ncbi:MAG: 5-bromo-4-chloroindolyl phosphate hydrolysis family protein [Hespellia sp.]|nr:5-bromo-4-chloroindolyl phosphate hydrolysis family protein [Hespellia sp.]